MLLGVAPSLRREDAQTLSNLRWLARLRWAALLAEALTILTAWHFFALDLPLGPLLLLLGLSGVINGILVAWLASEPVARPWMLAGLMALDFVQLTGLLVLSGGPSNPFSVLYLVDVALAAVVLAPTYAWPLAGLSTLCFGSLFLLAPEHTMHAHMHQDMGMHYQGMWLAFAVAAFVIVYFVTRVAGEAAESRLLAARSERLASLATLAAGAAHELATPLSTVAIVAGELEHLLQTSAPQAVSDVRIIREEVSRCREILSSMASDAGESAGEGLEWVQLSKVLDRAQDMLADPACVHRELSEELACSLVCLPPRAIARVLQGLIKNGVDAAGAAQLVARADGENVLIEVRDRGPGIDAALLARVGEPFFTTKEPGRGMGLGVFLARATLERLGGQLFIRSELGVGTTVTMQLRRNAAWTRPGREVKPSLR